MQEPSTDNNLSALDPRKVLLEAKQIQLERANEQLSLSHPQLISYADIFGDSAAEINSLHEGVLDVLKRSKEVLMNVNNLTAAKILETQRRVIPSRLPLSLDYGQLVRERERLFEQRRSEKMALLEAQLAAASASDDRPTRDRLALELKGLRLAGQQRRLREMVLRVSHASQVLDGRTDRSAYRRNKKQSLREARLTEKLERQQRLDRSRRDRQAHLEYLGGLVSHARDFWTAHRNQQQRRARIVRQVMQHHAAFEREEAKRIEKLSRDRIKALRADDEEGYFRLLDQQKDTRLTHLLRQTDEFLEGLAEKVAEQQRILGEDGEETSVEVADESVAKVRDYYGQAHRISERVEAQPSLLVGGQLKEYQLKGLQWMLSLYNNHLNGILADEMGLGKTIQTIALIAHLVEKKGQTGPFLVIVPLSTLTNWSVEFEKWAPSLLRVEYRGVPSQRKALQAQLRQAKFNVLLTTYEYIIKDRPFLCKHRWLYMIIDEGHRMKNNHSKLSTILTQHYNSRFRLILTGTPLQNNLPELWSLLNFVLPRIFNSCRTFEEWFNAPFAGAVGDQQQQQRIELNEEETLLIIRRLHKVLRPFLLRRLKKDVESELPEKVECILKCPMSALQASLYASIRREGSAAVNNVMSTGIRKLNNTIMQLRKICNHPFLFNEVERLVNPHHGNNELLWRAAGKFELLQRILPKFLATGHRMLIFFQMTQVMTIMEDMLAMQHLPYLRLDGSTKSEDRGELLRQFNAPDSPYSIFLLSTRAGGLGLNLQTADTVIIYDSDWNPHQDLQAQDRAHRIGQTKEVRIFRLVTQDSVEEYILERAQFKLSLDGKVIQAGKFDQKSTNEEREAMLRALFESEAEKNDVDDVYSDDELNELLARSDQELSIFRQIDQERDGVRGGKSRLMEAHEMPDIYVKALLGDEQGSEEKPKVATARIRREISYDETSMTDDQWLLLNGAGANDEGENDSDQDQVEDSDLPTAINRRKRLSGENNAASSPRRLKLTLSRATQTIDDSSVSKTKIDEFLLTPDERRRIMEQLLEAIENCYDDRLGRYRCELFTELPSPTDYPDYYQLIDRPISLAQIQGRLGDSEEEDCEASPYTQIAEMVDDLELMWANACRYNLEGSVVYEDAQVLQQLVRDLLAELLGRHGVEV